MKAPRTPASRQHARIWPAIAAAALAIVVVGYVVITRAQGPAPAGASTEPMTNAPPRTPNRLVHEKSPYLMQHAYNPVDWYPWGPEAFEKAKRENKPIFLSIGYSTCHWCHVMERESFENDSVAALMNELFVSIKVDREERPDVDRIYMHAVQAMGVGGGWPLNVFLTPDLKPFYGGTYYPPDGRMGRPGMMELLPRIHEVWTQQRDDVETNAQRVMEALAALTAPDSGSTDRAPLFDSAYAYLERAFDAEHGGFGQSPKFPSTVNLNFLLRYWSNDRDARKPALDMVLAQLDAMRRGGIHDHLGGGFHRYATDANWLVPHFEKMLYDQAQIAWAYLEAYQITGRKEDAATARGIFDYVARDLTSPDGAFYSAEDADSEGEEGKFYVWTPEEVHQVLGDSASEIFAHFYGVTVGGNFEHGTTILSEVADLERLSMGRGYSPEHAAQTLAESRAKLLEVRSKRVRPHLDDKVLVAWNGLMISALARGARVLDEPALAERAARAADFVWKRLYDEKTGEFKRRWRDGEAAEAGQLDDYAYFALGCIDLYSATFDPRWLERAAHVTNAQIARFWDVKDGAFFESPAGDPHVAIRMKDGFDGAEMAGNSIAALNLQLLGSLLDREEWLTKARQTFDYYATRLQRGAAAMPQMLVAMDLERATPRHIVIAGDPGSDDTRTLVDAFNRRFLPHDEMLLVSRGSAKQLGKLTPFTEPLTQKDGRATAYVCVNYACQLPTTDPEVFSTQLDRRPAARGVK